MQALERPIGSGKTRSASDNAKPADPIPSSSRAFATPNQPKPNQHRKSPALSEPSILPILLPPTTLRPLAFRTFTKKHNLNLTSSALQVLAAFIGKHCGSAWRDDGLAEKVLDHAAKQWKKNGGGVLVPGEGDDLATILRSIQIATEAGKLRMQPSSNKQEAALHTDSHSNTNKNHSLTDQQAGWVNGQDDLDASALGTNHASGTDNLKEARQYLTVVSAFEQPRLSYNAKQKHFDHGFGSSSLLATTSHKTHMFRQRYHLAHQRLLRNESFQTSAVTSAQAGTRHTGSSRLSTLHAYKITPIANLLGRGGSIHMLLGVLSRSPSGLLTINDLTGSINIDIQGARPSPEDGIWFTPGMIVVVDGRYEDEESKVGCGLDGNAGVGGTIGGVFVVFGMTGPPCERREASLGLSSNQHNISGISGAGFGWVDFLGMGSENAVGTSMRNLEARVLRKGAQRASGSGRDRIILLGEVNLDDTQTHQAIRKVLATYAMESVDRTPGVMVLMGNFVRHAIMTSGGGGGSIECKEYFDALASVLSDYPTMLQSTTFIFVPGDHDPWASAFSAGASTVIPRSGIPDIFTSRIRKLFTTVNAEANRMGKKGDGEAIWTTNPSRIAIFGPSHEIVLFRDDMSSRLRRNALRFATRPQSQHPDGGGGDEQQRKPCQPHDASQGPMEKQSDGTTEVASEEAALSNAPQERHPTTVDTAVSPDIRTTRRLVKTILDQGHLSPFPPSQRPVLWDFASSLQLYPLPASLVLMDAEAPAFAVGLDGCHVMNPGPIKAPGKKGVAQWIEYDIRTRRGKLKEAHY